MRYFLRLAVMCAVLLSFPAATVADCNQECFYWPGATGCATFTNGNYSMSDCELIVQCMPVAGGGKECTVFCNGGFCFYV